MNTQVVEPSTKAKEWGRGERLAGVTVSRNWVRKHFGDVAGVALRNARAGEKKVSAWPQKSR